MSRFLQLCLIFFAAAAAIVSDASADEAAISNDYFYDYDLYSYDDIIDALYSDEGENNKKRYCFDQTTTQEPFFPAEELLPSESRQRPQRRKKRPRGQKRKKQQEFAKANQEVRYLQ